MSEEKDKDQKDGLVSISDSVEAQADFQEELENLHQEFFKENNPEFYALMQKHGGVQKTIDEIVDEDDDAD